MKTVGLINLGVVEHVRLRLDDYDQIYWGNEVVRAPNHCGLLGRKGGEGPMIYIEFTDCPCGAHHEPSP